MLLLPSIHSFSSRKTMWEKKTVSNNQPDTTSWLDVAEHPKPSPASSAWVQFSGCSQCEQGIPGEALEGWKTQTAARKLILATTLSRAETKKASLKQMGRGHKPYASWHFHESGQAWDGHVDTKNSHSPRFKLLPKCKGDSLNKLCTLDDNHLNVWCIYHQAHDDTIVMPLIKWCVNKLEHSSSHKVLDEKADWNLRTFRWSTVLRKNSVRLSSVIPLTLWEIDSTERNHWSKLRSFKRPVHAFHNLLWIWQSRRSQRVWQWISDFLRNALRSYQMIRIRPFLSVASEATENCW